MASTADFRSHHRAPLRVAAALIAWASLALSGCTAATPAQRTFASPEEAVRALNDAVKAGRLDDVVAIFGAEGKELVDSSDAATARQNREIFVAAVAERWRLEEQGADTRVLVIGNEDWPFPVPLIKDGNAWRFDTAAGKEEVLSRRVGRNELAAIRICGAYVNAQHLYAARAHDGKPAGLFAQSFRSDRGRQNGLYWPAARGEKPSPLGDLVAQAAEEGTPVGQGKEPAPFHGYFFKIVTRQGAAAPGGARDYIANGGMSGGFALVAWPAQYDVTGVMTFVVNQDGSVRQKDLGPDTASAARALGDYNPDDTWSAAAGASRQ